MTIDYRTATNGANRYIRSRVRKYYAAVDAPTLADLYAAAPDLLSWQAPGAAETTHELAEGDCIRLMSLLREHGDNAAQDRLRVGMMGMYLAATNGAEDARNDTTTAHYLEDMHVAWRTAHDRDSECTLPNPLLRLIRAWAQRPERVQPYGQLVMPYAAMHRNGRTEKQRLAIPGPAHTRREHDAQLILSGFETGREGDEIYLPEALYQLEEKGKRGHVPKALRTLVYALLRTPPRAVANPNGYAFSVSGKEFIRTIHRANRETPRPARWIPEMRDIRQELAGIEIPYTDAQGRTHLWTPVAITRTPWNANDDIRFFVDTLEGYQGTGVGIDDALWDYTGSAQDFYLLLSLPFHWERVGNTSTPIKGGGILRRTTIDAYPEITKDAIVNMQAPFSPRRSRQNLLGKAFDRIERLALESGAFQIARKGNSRILLPKQVDFSGDELLKRGWRLIRRERD